MEYPDEYTWALYLDMHQGENIYVYFYISVYISYLLVGYTISNIISRLFMLIMQSLSLYLQLYAKSNLNILYTYMLNALC